VITVSAADPTNLAGIVLPGERVAAIPGKQLLYRNGRIFDNREDADTADDRSEDLTPVQLGGIALNASLPIF
jgi:ATP-dependent Lhr-like helicase